MWFGLPLCFVGRHINENLNEELLQGQGLHVNVTTNCFSLPNATMQMSDEFYHP
jgi:hypothetical protein